MILNWNEPSVGMEAIAYQEDSKLYKGLTEVFSKAEEADATDASKLKELGIVSTVLEHCGILINPDILPYGGINAAVQVPDLDKNPAIVSEIRRGWADADDLKKVIQFTDGIMEGMLDRKNSKVHGMFSKLVCNVYFTPDFLTSKKLTPGKRAAILLHELGHVYSYFEHLVDLTTMNLAIRACVDRMYKTDDHNVRIKLLGDLKMYGKINVKDVEDTAKVANMSLTYVKLITDSIKGIRSSDGAMKYSYRSFEFAADQFAVRHGAGADLATALNDVQRSIFNPSYQSWPLFIFIEALSISLKIVSLALGGAFTAIYYSILLLASRPMDKIYDDPRARFDRIEREIVGGLKDRSISKSQRQRLLAQLEVVKDTKKSVEDKMGLLELCWEYVIPSGNEQRKAREFQVELEKLANNELYSAAALLARS